MRPVRAPRPLYWLGALLVLYLGYPVGAFIWRVITGSDEGWNAPGLFAALRVSVEGATIAVLIGVLFGIPLAYVLAHRRGPIASIVGVIVQLPLAVPPLISGILLIYITGPYTFLGKLSGERLTETMIGVVIAQTFVSLPFLVVIARSAFRAVDPSLGDVAATLGHGRMARFLRVDVPVAGDGLRTGLILMWLRAFGEYGTVVVLAYHPYSLPVYVDNLFSSAPLSQAEAPTLLAFGVAAIAILISRLRRPARVWRRELPAPVPPVTAPPTAVGFDLDTRVGDFHLQVMHPERSHRLAIVGPSGSGKSATLLALAGLLGQAPGTVTFGGADVTRVAAERRHVGYVPQGFGLIPGQTVWQQTLFGVGADPGRGAWWLDTLHLTDLHDRRPDELSGGQRQRVSLARALATDPRLVLLDEPFSALDAPVRYELRRELRRLQREVNLSTVIVTHDPEEAAMLADEVMVISDGEVLQAGTCREVYQRPDSPQIGRLVGIDNLFQATSGGGILAALESGIASGSPVLWQVPADAVLIEPSPAGLQSARASLQTTASADDPDPSVVVLGAGLVVDIIDLGRSVELILALDCGSELRARTRDLPELAVGDRALARAPRDAISFWRQPSSSSAGAATPNSGARHGAQPPM